MLVLWVQAAALRLAADEVGVVDVCVKVEVERRPSLKRVPIAASKRTAAASSAGVECVERVTDTVLAWSRLLG